MKQFFALILFIVFLNSISFANDYNKYLSDLNSINKNTDENIKYNKLSELISKYPDYPHAYIYLGINIYNNSNKEFSGQFFIDGFSKMTNEKDRKYFYELVNNTTQPMPGKEDFKSFKIAYEMIEKNQAKNAIPILIKLVKHNPKNTKLLYELAYAYIEINDFTSAKKYLEIIYKINPISFEVLRELTYLYSELGDVENLEKVYNIRKSVNFYGPDTTHELAVAYYKNKEYDKCLELLDKNIKQTDYVLSKITLGIIYYEKYNDCSKSVPLLKSAMNSAEYKKITTKDSKHSFESTHNKMNIIIKSCEK